MNAAADRLDDSYPHGTIAGYDGGCKGNVCPAGADHGLSCRKAKLLQASDYRYAKLARAGKTPGEIADELGLNPDPSAAPSKPSPAQVAKVTKKPTAKPVIDPYDDELDDEVLDEDTTEQPVDVLAETAAQPLAGSSQDRRPEHDAADEPAEGPASAERDAAGIREEMGHLTLAMLTKGLSKRAAIAKGAEIREWIRTHGWPDVAGRGTIPQEALTAYAAAHDEATQEPTEPDAEPPTHVFVMATTEPTMDNTGARSVPVPPPGSGRTKEELAEIRAWAAEVGMPCATFGRVPRAVLDAYAAAHPDADAKREIAPMTPTTQPPALAEPPEHELAGVTQALGGGEPSEVGPAASEQESHGGTVPESITDEDAPVITYAVDGWPQRSEEAEALDTAHRSELLDEVRERIQPNFAETPARPGALASGSVAGLMQNRPEWGEVAAAADVEKAREIAARLFLELTDAEAARDQAERALELTLQKWSDAADRATMYMLRLGMTRTLLRFNRDAAHQAHERAKDLSDTLAERDVEIARMHAATGDLVASTWQAEQRAIAAEAECARLRALIEAEAIATPRRRRALRRAAG